MRTPRLVFAVVPLLALFISACGHLDTTPEPRGDRTLTGTVHFRAQTELPADAKATVRLFDMSNADAPAQVLSEQVISPVTSSPIAFTLDYKAEDLIPPKRVRLDARISVNGKLRYYSASSYSVTTEKAARPIELWIEATSH
jgi:putative lipoprotein